MEDTPKPLTPEELRAVLAKKMEMTETLVSAANAGVFGDIAPTKFIGSGDPVTPSLATTGKILNSSNSEQPDDQPEDAQEAPQQAPEQPREITPAKNPESFSEPPAQPNATSIQPQQIKAPALPKPAKTESPSKDELAERREATKKASEDSKRNLSRQVLSKANEQYLKKPEPPKPKEAGRQKPPEEQQIVQRQEQGRKPAQQPASQPPKEPKEKPIQAKPGEKLSKEDLDKNLQLSKERQEEQRKHRQQLAIESNQRAASGTPFGGLRDMPSYSGIEVDVGNKASTPQDSMALSADDQKNQMEMFASAVADINSRIAQILIIQAVRIRQIEAQLQRL